MNYWAGAALTLTCSPVQLRKRRTYGEPTRFPSAAPGHRLTRYFCLLVQPCGRYGGIAAKYTVGKVYLDAKVACLVGLLSLY